MSFLRNKKILIIAPHPDDEAICCGGLIMLAKKQQARVFVLYMAIGTSRQLQTGQTSAKDRIPEIKKAARYGNFQYKLAFQGDQFMRLDSLPQKDLIEVIEDTIEAVRPDIVCLPFRFSFDQDHRAVSTAAITALRPLPSSLRHQPSMILEYEEPYTWTTGKILTPTVFFDITRVIKQKIRLLKQHKTQIRNDPFPRSPENLIRLAGMRGCEASTRYAEGYQLLRGTFL